MLGLRLGTPALRLGLVLTGLLSSAAYAQDLNLLQKATSISGSCGQINEQTLTLLTDGAPKTAVQTYRTGACELVFRFDAPVAASKAVLSMTYPGEGRRNKSSFATIWGSHQAFGNAFFKLGEAKFAPDSVADISFEEPIKLRSLKILLEASGKDGWPRGSSGNDVRLHDVLLLGAGDASDVSRWPQPPMPPLSGKSDALVQSEATDCDELAGFPFNPDSYGHNRSDQDLDIPKALKACEIDVAAFPSSARLAFNLARVELLGERAPKAVARLSSALLADYAPAQYLLAKSFEDGTGVQKNKQKARLLYEKSAEQNFGPALLWLAEQAHEAITLDIAKGNISGDQSAIETNLKKAVELGYLPASPLYFKHVLKYGQLPVRAAYDRLEAAAELGDRDIMIEYGVHLYNGYKISPRYADSRRYMLRAARLNRHTAMTNYAADAFSSNGWYWKRRAAYSGEYWPLEQVAKSIKDEKMRAFLAKLAFEKADSRAKEGDASAMEWVAQYYSSGFGTEKDAEQARLWRCRAQAAGDPLALSTPVQGGCSND